MSAALPEQTFVIVAKIGNKCTCKAAEEGAANCGVQHTYAKGGAHALELKDDIAIEGLHYLLHGEEKYGLQAWERFGISLVSSIGAAELAGLLSVVIAPTAPPVLVFGVGLGVVVAVSLAEDQIMKWASNVPAYLEAYTNQNPATIPSMMAAYFDTLSHKYTFVHTSEEPAPYPWKNWFKAQSMEEHVKRVKCRLEREKKEKKHRDPLILDLNGDGIKTTNVDDGAFFDPTGTGFVVQTAWVAPGDGLLVMDRNGDGIINDGKELFGNETMLKDGTKAANGFQALAELDGNVDGKIDAADTVFSRLRVWEDENGEGISSPSELHTLEDLDIKSISLDSAISNGTDAQGNTQNRQAFTCVAKTPPGLRETTAIS